MFKSEGLIIMKNKKSKLNYNPPGTVFNDLEELLDLLCPPLRDHSRRVAVCCALIAENAGEFLRDFDFVSLRTDHTTLAHIGGTCHDIGKLMIPVLSVKKEDYLKHTILGADFLEQHKDILFENEEQGKTVIDIVRLHHEHADGSGFPFGLKTVDIPLIAEICALANWLDHAFYDKKLTIQRVLNNDKLKTLFSESVLLCLERSSSQIKKQYEKWNNFC